MRLWISNRCGAWPAPACRSSLGGEVFRSLATPRRWARSVSPGAQQIKKTSNAPKPVLKLWIREVDRFLRPQVCDELRTHKSDSPLSLKGESDDSCRSCYVAGRPVFDYKNEPRRRNLLCALGGLHLSAAYAVYHVGVALEPGMARGRVFQDAWNLLFFGVTAIVVALILNTGARSSQRCQ
jgi:hypothetical protein